MKKITISVLSMVFSLAMFAQSTIEITTSGGSFPGEKWVSITTEVNGGGTQVYGQGNGTQCDGSGLLTNEVVSLAPGTYYVNCYDQYDDSWDGTLISVTAYGLVIGDNGGVSPTDGEDTDASSACEGTPEELEVSFEIVVPNPPSCPAPTSLDVSAVTGSSANLSWSTGGSEIGYEYALLLATDAPPTSGTQTASTSFNAMNLTEGTDYTFYVRAFCNPEFSDFASVDFRTPEVGEACGNSIAITLQSDCDTATPTVVDFSTAVDLGPIFGCDSAGTNNGFWFDFTTGATGGTVFNVSGTSNEIAIFDSCGGTELFCGGLNQSLTLSGLSPNTSYKVAVWRDSFQTLDAADVCFEDVACLFPTDLDATVVTTTSTNISWTPGNTPAETAWEYVVQDQGTGVPSAAGTSTSNNPTTVTGLVEGTSYEFYVRADCGSGTFSAWSGPFVFSQSLPPANDECITAIELTVATDETCNSVSATTIAASESAPGCAGTADDDVWFKFTALGTNHNIVVTNTGGTSDIVTQVLDSCGGTELVCQDSPNSPIILENLTIGTEYVFRIYSWSGTTSTRSSFDVCVITPDPPAPVPANDECGNAAVLTLSSNQTCDNALSGSTESATPSTSNCTGGRDVWYSFTPSTNGDYVASVSETFESSSFISTYIAVFEGACGGLTQIGSSTSCFNTGNITFTGVAGTTYYYAVRSSSTTGYTEFDICTFAVPAPPANDACTGAITINNGDTLTGDNSFATNVEMLTACSGGTLGTTCTTGVNDGTIDFGAGLWYVYVSDGNETINVQAGGFDTEVQVFSGTCGALVCVAGDDDSGNNGNNSQVCFDASTAETYYIYVDGHASNVGEFTVTLIATPLPPANDDCADAEAVTFGNEISASNTGATDSNVTGTCFTGNIRDVWYSAVADATGEIYVNSLTAGFQYAIYSDCSGTEVSCNAGATGLTDGSTYYIRITDDGTGTTRASGAFSFTPSTVALSTNDFDSELGFKYYPNPVKNTLTLDAQQNIDTVVMYNMLGQEVLRLSPKSISATVDMSNLNTGAYFATVSILGNKETVRVIKQ